MESSLLTPEEAAAFLKVSLNTLEKWRRKGSGPKFSRLGHRTVRYSPEDLKAWLHQVAPTQTNEEAK